MNQVLLSRLALLTACLAYFSVLNTDAVHSSKISVNFTELHGVTLEDGSLHEQHLVSPLEKSGARGNVAS
jgi:hypothetical protein